MGDVLAELEDTTPKPQKKTRPGRPKKVKDILPPNITGVAQTPRDPGDRVEMECNYPATMTKIISIMSDYAAAEVDLVFGARGCEIYAKDHMQKVDIYVNLPGVNMTHYFCARPTRVRINQNNFRTIVNGINKSCSNITFILLEKDYKLHLHVLVRENIQDSITSFKIDVITADDPEPAQLPNDAEYPLCFSIAAANFKQQITTMKSYERMTIDKSSNDGITLIAEKTRGKQTPDIHTSYPINALLNLTTKVTGDEVFQATIRIENIRRFALKAMGEVVRVAADLHNKITFSTTMKDKEGAALIKIYVEHAVYGSAD